MKSLRLLAPVFAFLSLASVHALGQDVKQLVATNCAKCHGLDGNPESPKYPKLAGQHKPYLLGQLKAFRDHSRKDPDAHSSMWEVSRQLNDDLDAKLAAYFSTQKPARGTPGDPKLAAKGKEIYERGIRSKNVPGCVLCHGRDGQGMSVFPRLAGQDAQYLLTQLKVFHTDDRPNLAVTMKPVVEKLSEHEAMQVAAYLQGL